MRNLVRRRFHEPDGLSVSKTARLSISNFWLSTPMVLICIYASVRQLGLLPSLVLAIGLLIVVLLGTVAASARSTVFLAMSFMPLEGVVGQVPFVATLGKYAQPLTAMLMLSVALISIPRVRMRRVEPTARHLAVAVTAILTASAVARGLPSSVMIALQLVNCVLVVAVTKRLGLSDPGQQRRAISVLGVATGIYASVLVATSNPLTLIRSASPELFLTSGSVSNPNRLAGFGGDYELLAQMLAVGLVCLASLYLSRGQEHRPTWMTLSGLTGVCLLATASLYGVIAALLGVGALIIKRRVGSNPVSLRKVGLLLFVILVSVPGLSIVQARLTVRGLSIEDLLGKVSNPALILNRSTVWNSVVHNPHFDAGSLVGSGLPFPLEDYGTLAHSMFLTVLVTTGLSGLIAFSALWLSTFWKSLLCLRSSAAMPVGLAALILLGGNILNEVTRLGSFMTEYVFVLYLCVKYGSQIERDGSE